MLLEDGRIGLIDWGQVKRIGQAERVCLAKLLIALADRDEVLAADLMAATGFATRTNDPWVLHKWAAYRFSRWTDDVVGELGGMVNFERLLGNLDPITVEAQEYVMPFRMSALLRGNALGLGDLTIDSAKRWRPHAVALLDQLSEPTPRTVPGRKTQRSFELPTRFVSIVDGSMAIADPTSLDTVQ